MLLRDTAKIAVLYAVSFSLVIYAAAQFGVAMFVLLSMPLFVLWFGNYLSANLDYRCPRCDSEFRISTLATLLTLQQVYFRLLKCPNCGEVSWCRIVRYRGKEVTARAKQIDERGKTNHAALVAVLITAYVVYTAIWPLKPDLLMLAVVTTIFAYFAAIVIYAARNGYNSSMYFLVVFAALFVVGIMSFLQVLMIVASG